VLRDLFGTTEAGALKQNRAVSHTDTNKTGCVVNCDSHFGANARFVTSRENLKSFNVTNLSKP
jgi:hypothetical protein